MAEAKQYESEPQCVNGEWRSIGEIALKLAEKAAAKQASGHG
ncbi:hypothetical protein [Oceaniglobus ichthyenteri]|nr:hypothetical protein [Oceaniglobus ichthyenteri]